MTLDPSDTAPVFSLPDAAGNLVSLADFRLERAKYHPKFAAKYQLPFPRLCDSKAEVAQQLRLLPTQKVYGSRIYGHYSIDRERARWYDGKGLPLASNQNLTQRRF
ncbi:hypothetical protein [Microcoleus sp. A006_D1]|uniref:hypothetical protein n=1 Tax=Microcoleus sp. A006_D1 TaxID=3055267 RepID=UPI002FD44907